MYNYVSTHVLEVSLKARTTFPPFRRPRAVFRVNNASMLRRIHYKRGVVGRDEISCLICVAKIDIVEM